MAKKEFWTIVIVTAVTVLIWFWAAGETLSQRSVNARLAFDLPEPESWLITPRQRFVSVSMEGSKLAMQQADQILRNDLRVPLQAMAGRQTIDMAEAAQDMRDLQATGVKVLSFEPGTIDVDVDQIVRVQSRVRASLPGVQTVGEIRIEPAEVTLAMPNALRQRFTGDLPVEAFVDRTRLDRLTPGERHTLSVKLRPPDGLASAEGVSVEPSTVQLSFAMRSRTREMTLDSVRIQLAGPPEDNVEYLVELDETVLRDVTITAEADLIRRIEANEATVVAMLHLSNREKELGIESKPISYFLAMVTDDLGHQRGVVVDARVGDTPQLPSVNFQVIRRPLP